MRVKNWLQFIVHHDKILQLATYVLGQLPPALSTEEQEKKAREEEDIKSILRDSEQVKVAELDTDGDGKISLAEFIAGGGTEEEFKALDTDGSGQIDEAEVNERDVKKIAAETINHDIHEQSSNADDSYVMKRDFPPSSVCEDVESKIGFKDDRHSSDKRRQILANSYVKFDLGYLCCLLWFLIDESVRLQEG